jgi:hypothetical protein
VLLRAQMLDAQTELRARIPQFDKSGPWDQIVHQGRGILHSKCCRQSSDNDIASDRPQASPQQRPMTRIAFV